MSQHTARLAWSRAESEAFTDGRYSRRHTLAFDGGAVVPGSASPQVVRPPFSDPAAVDPEEAFVAALAACHMLWFLSLAAGDGWVVDAYDDEARGQLAPDAEGRLAMAEVVLAPRVRFGGERKPGAEALADLHHRAHEACFLARSVRCPVHVRPAFARA